MNIEPIQKLSIIRSNSQQFAAIRSNSQQFAAILLANIEVFKDGYLNGLASFKPAQENSLDEILRINGVNI